MQLEKSTINFLKNKGNFSKHLLLLLLKPLFIQNLNESSANVGRSWIPEYECGNSHCESERFISNPQVVGHFPAKPSGVIPGDLPL